MSPHVARGPLQVLCGSRKYPIKEPFVELMKGSLNTFLNAFTYPDRTCYPVGVARTHASWVWPHAAAAGAGAVPRDACW